MKWPVVAFLIAAGIQAASHAAEPAAAGASNWAFSTNVDPITDRKEGSAWLVSVDGRSRLSLVCRGVAEPVLSLQFRAPEYLGNSFNSVFVRIDQGDLLPHADWDYQAKVAYVTDGSWLSSFQQALGTGEHRIVIRALDYENQPHDGVFVSKNASAVLSQISDLCRATKPAAK